MEEVVDKSMIIKTEKLQSICKILADALDTNAIYLVTESLGLKTAGDKLILGVTNREYFAKATIQLDQVEEEMNATITASGFLKLIAMMNSDEIELKVVDNCLTVKGNGYYKFPLIYVQDKLLELPPIEVENITTEMEVDASVLSSVYTYNSSWIGQNAMNVMQKMYYIDENGALTFTSGACVNNFTLPKPIQLFLQPKVVKLFKLFDTNSKVGVYLGRTELQDGTLQTRVKFVDSNFELSTILPIDESLYSKYPKDAIRGRATKTYTHNVVVNVKDTINSLSRLKLLSDDNYFGEIKFKQDHCELYLNDNEETLGYYNECDTLQDGYDLYIDFNKLIEVLKSGNEEYVTLSFGDSQAVVVSQSSIRNVIPEVKKYE